MSTLASFILIECDCCKKTIGLKSDEDWNAFGETWFEGLSLHFCPDCKTKLETQADIKDQEIALADLEGFWEVENVTV